MLERAKGCFEHNGLRLLRLRSEPSKTQRLHYAFWSHGAGDIELPGWWADLLSRPSQEEKEKVGSADDTSHYLRAGFKSGHFLDFLYPSGARSHLHKLATHNPTRRSRPTRNPAQTSGFSSHATSHPRWNTDTYPTNDHVSNLVQDLRQVDAEAIDTDASSSNELSDGAFLNSTGGSFEEQLEQLYSSIKRYHSSLTYYDRTMRTIDEIDPGLNSATARREALVTAAQTIEDGDQLTTIMEDLVLDYLHDHKEMANWAPRDWTVALRIHIRRGDTSSQRFIRTFDTCLEGGLASTVIPQLIKLIVLGKRSVGSRRYSICHELYSRYTAWVMSNAPKSSSSTQSFWAYAVTSDRRGRTPVSDLRSFFLDLMKHAPPMPDSTLPPAFMAATFAGLAKAIISHRTFTRLHSSEVLDFFTHVLQIVKAAPAAYATMHSLLKNVLFAPLSGVKRRYADLHASRLLDAMEIYGGYKGEKSRKEPDLARKLFFHLTRADLTVEAQKVMANIQQRNKDQTTDYARLRFQLSRKGDVDAIAKQEVALARAEGRLHDRDPELQARLQAPPMDLYRTRLETHRRRNETDAMLEVLEEMRNDRRVELDGFTYSVLISGFARTGDLAGANAMFQQMVEAGIKPDIHAYIPIIQALARQGDIVAIRDMTSEMEAHGIELNDWVINAHVYALLQRGNLTAAETLIWRALTFKLESRTKMWNYVLLHWALRGHRRKVNLLMNRMKANKIPRDAFTYACRMQLWLVHKSPRRAWSILHTTMPRLGLQALPFHYALVIRGLAQSTVAQDHLKIPQVYSEMLRKGVHPDWNVKVALSDAFVRWNRLRTPQQIIRRIKHLIAEAERRRTGSSPLIMSKDVGDQAEVFANGMFDFIFRISPRKNFIARFDDIWATFVDFLKNTGPKPFNPPLRIMYRLMDLFRSQGAWSEVRKCWVSLLEKAEQLGKTSDWKVNIGSRRSILTKPLYTYMRCLHDQGAPIDEIKELIADVLKRGFEVDNRCWNLYVRLLCVSGPQYHLLALETAEEQVVHGLLYYPPILGSVKVPENRAKIIQGKMSNRLNDVYAFRSQAKPHFPFRVESSIGRGYDVPRLNDLPSAGWRHVLDNSKSWSEIEAQAKETGPAIPPSTFELKQKLEGRSKPEHHEIEDLSNRLTNLDTGRASQLTGLTSVTTFLHEGSLLRRPEYATMVYLAGVYAEWRRRLAFDSSGQYILREIHEKAPRVVEMIMKLPRIDDNLQKSVLRGK